MVYEWNEDVPSVMLLRTICGSIRPVVKIAKKYYLQLYNAKCNTVTYKPIYAKIFYC